MLRRVGQNLGLTGRFVLVGATLLDGTGEESVRGHAVVVEDGRIAAVVADTSAPPGPRLALDGLTLLPGLVNCHVHLCLGERYAW